MARSKRKSTAAESSETPTKRSKRVIEEESEEEEEEEEFEVEKIMGHDFDVDGTILFRVRWKNYGPKDDTWEPEESFTDSVMYEEYYQKLGGKPEPPAPKEKKGKGKKEAKPVKDKPAAKAPAPKPPTKKSTASIRSDSPELEPIPSLSPSPAKRKNGGTKRLPPGEPVLVQVAPLSYKDLPPAEVRPNPKQARWTEENIPGPVYDRARWDDYLESIVTLHASIEGSKELDTGILRWKPGTLSDNSVQSEHPVTRLLEKCSYTLCKSLLARAKSMNKRRKTSLNPIEPTTPEQSFEVERILGHDFDLDGKILLKVRWKGYGPKDDTWEPEESFDSPALYREYYKKVGEKPKAPRTDSSAGAKKMGGKSKTLGTASPAGVENKDGKSKAAWSAVEKKKGGRPKASGGASSLAVAMRKKGGTGVMKKTTRKQSESKKTPKKSPAPTSSTSDSPEVVDPSLATTPTKTNSTNAKDDVSPSTPELTPIPSLAPSHTPSKQTPPPGTPFLIPVSPISFKSLPAPNVPPPSTPQKWTEDNIPDSVFEIPRWDDYLETEKGITLQGSDSQVDKGTLRWKAGTLAEGPVFSEHPIQRLLEKCHYTLCKTLWSKATTMAKR
ncbi:hypothetical protein HDV05_002866 [Chytridiales sp. JEL 0842]|nr:hypothetical protein HDV05_002866 [Chytridiales sp. JEL 0842]